jgi:integrase
LSEIVLDLNDPDAYLMPSVTSKEQVLAKAMISKGTVDAAMPAEKDVILWDKKLPGFGLKVTPAGGKSYFYRFRLARPGEAERTAPAKYSIGKHGELTPQQARNRAQELAALVAQGIDPRELEADKRKAKDDARLQAEAKARLEADLAFARMAGLWLVHYEDEKARRPSSVRQAKLVVEKYLSPALGNKPMPHITRADLLAILDAVPVTKKAMRRAVFAYASVLFGWAAGRGDIERNPLVDMVKPIAPKARDRVLDDDELLEVWNAAATMPKLWSTFYRIAILTGQRREEVAALRWAELDRPAREWVIPADRAKNGVVHIVPLSDGVIAELDALAETESWPRAGFVLTTTGVTPISGFSKAKKVLDERVLELRRKGSNAELEVGNLPAWRLHDLRRTVATGLQRLGIRFEVTEAVLNHVSGAKGGVAGIYQRHDWKDEKRAALGAWAAHVQRLTKEADRTNVVPLGVRV